MHLKEEWKEILHITQGLRNKLKFCTVKICTLKFLYS